jgi:hypothetical protein
MAAVTSGLAGGLSWAAEHRPAEQVAVNKAAESTIAGIDDLRFTCWVALFPLRDVDIIWPFSQLAAQFASEGRRAPLIWSATPRTTLLADSSTALHFTRKLIGLLALSDGNISR